MPFVEGVVVERYRLDRLIGEGGMGMVWAATHRITNKSVAIKMLKPSHAGDARLRERFLREARAACTVAHPNIVAVHDVIEHEETVMLVMDLLEGESLGDRLDREGKLSIEEFATAFVQVVSAVGTAHASGVVHRDLKPDNIFLSKDISGKTVARVLDFGIAKVFLSEADADVASLTGTGALLGTPYYMSPEQIFGEKDVDHRTDIWSLGVIFYECLSGKRPTQADNIGGILKLVSNDAIVPLRKVTPDLPPDLLDLVERMMSRERERRPRSLAEVQRALARFAPAIEAPAFGEPVQTRSSRETSDARRDIPATLGATASLTPAVPGLAEPLERSIDATAAPPPTPTSPKRTPPFWVIAVVTMVGIATFVAWRQSGPSPASSSSSSVQPPSPIASTAVIGPEPSAMASAVAPPPSTAFVRSSATIRSQSSAPSASASSSTASSHRAPGGVIENPPF